MTETRLHNTVDGSLAREFKPSLMTTGIGSVPFLRGEDAVNFVLDAGFPELVRVCK